MQVSDTLTKGTHRPNKMVTFSINQSNSPKEEIAAVRKRQIGIQSQFQRSPTRGDNRHLGRDWPVSLAYCIQYSPPSRFLNCTEWVDYLIVLHISYRQCKIQRSWKLNSERYRRLGLDNLSAPVYQLKSYWMGATKKFRRSAQGPDTH